MVAMAVTERGWRERGGEAAVKLVVMGIVMCACMLALFSRT